MRSGTGSVLALRARDVHAVGRLALPPQMDEPAPPCPRPSGKPFPRRIAGPFRARYLRAVGDGRADRLLRPSGTVLAFRLGDR